MDGLRLIVRYGRWKGSETLMEQHTRFFKRVPPAQEEQPMELGDILEPDGGEEQPPAYEDDYLEPPYDAEYTDMREDESTGHFKVAMGVFDTVSILVGVVVILLLVALLLSLSNWLINDVMHSVMLLQSGLK
ncbi:MAG: hypothetical protein RSB91_06205 [Clostridia bacterium]